MADTIGMPYHVEALVILVLYVITLCAATVHTYHEAVETDPTAYFKEGSIVSKHEHGKSHRRQGDQTRVSDEKQLTKHLNTRYEELGVGGRPVPNASEALVVRFGLAMIKMDLDERQNMLTTSVWCRYRWHDEYLTWDPKEFGDVYTARLDSKLIWIPDIMLYNTADTNRMERDVLAVVSHEGNVLWIPHRIYRSSCSVNIANYPFDTQTCDMTFGSWAYHGNEIKLGFFEDMEMLDISDMERENTEWEIISKTEQRREQYYDCCVDPYVTLTFTIHLKRKFVFSSYILTLPCVFLACMTLVVFWLPPERPDRTSLAMSLFASFLLLLLILVEAAPPTASSVPTLGLYYCFNMVLIMFSIFLSSVVINVNRRANTQRPVPRWIKALINRWKSIRAFSKCCSSRTESRRRNKARSQEIEDTTKVIANEDIMASSNMGNGIMNEVPPRYEKTSPEVALDLQTFKLVHSHFVVMETHLRKIENGVADMMATFKQREMTLDLRQSRRQWQAIASALDHFFFVLFLLAIIASVIALFPRPYALQF